MAGWTSPDRNDIEWDGRLIARNFKGDGSELTNVPLTGGETDPTFQAASAAFLQRGLVDNVSELINDAGYLTSAGAETDPKFQAVSAAIMAHIVHNLTTDIDHNAITNTHNLTTDINHAAITGAHNLTTDIDHTAIQNIGTKSHTVLEASAAQIVVDNKGLSGAFYTHEDMFDVLSGAYTAHIPMYKITSGAVLEVSGALKVLSGAYYAHLDMYKLTSGAVVEVSGALKVVSGAYYAHAADASNPHGTTLTQTNLTGTNVSSAYMAVTGDFSTASAAYVANIIYGVTSSAMTASNYPIGSVLVVYS